MHEFCKYVLGNLKAQYAFFFQTSARLWLFVNCTFLKCLKKKLLSFHLTLDLVGLLVFQSFMPHLAWFNNLEFPATINICCYSPKISFSSLLSHFCFFFSNNAKNSFCHFFVGESDKKAKKQNQTSQSLKKKCSHGCFWSLWMDANWMQSIISSLAKGQKQWTIVKCALQHNY